MKHEFHFFRCLLNVTLAVSFLYLSTFEIGAQDKKRNWRKDPVTYFVTLDGRLESLIGGLFSKPLKGSSSFANMLSHDCLLEEIECSTDQSKKIESKVGKSHRLEKQIRDLKNDNPYSEFNKATIKKLLEQYFDVDQEISDLLLAHQKQRLKQVFLRWELASLGIPRTIGLNLIPIEPPVRPEQSKLILEICQKEQKNIDQKIRAWKNSFVVSITKELNSEQKKSYTVSFPKSIFLNLSSCRSKEGD